MIVKLYLVELIKMLCIFNPNKTWLKKLLSQKYKLRQQKPMSKNNLESKPNFDFVINA